MEEAEKAIQKYIDEKKKLQKLVLWIIDDINDIDDTDDAKYQKLINILNMPPYKENKTELKHFLHLVSVISTNHHREANFFSKIEAILSISSKFYKPIFSSYELYLIFRESNPILLFLLKNQLITIDETIFINLMNYFIQFSKGVIIYYFYPELKSFIESNPTLERHFQISFTEVANFETNRQRFETKSALCSIIRDDLIEDFIQYVHQTNISLSSFLKRSFFDTNPILIEKEPSLIEYAAFYGSIQIMKYLETNNVEIKPSIWLYAVHSNNAEIIAFLEDKQIDIDDRTFSEAIKCHHNDIARYIYENYLDSSIIHQIIMNFSVMKLMEIIFFSAYLLMNIMNLLIFI